MKKNAVCKEHSCWRPQKADKKHPGPFCAKHKIVRHHDKKVIV